MYLLLKIRPFFFVEVLGLELRAYT
jgi:hypothetical protein